MSAKDKRKRVTVNDLLARDDINGMIDALNKVAPHIESAIIIYIDKRDNRYHWAATKHTLVPLAIWMLESVKLDLLLQEE